MGNCKCSNCGSTLTEEEIKFNDEVEKTTKRLEYCQECWSDYAHHAITGD
jgi:hypothetical protein